MDDFGIPIVPVLAPVQILQYGFSWQFLILVQGSVPNADSPCTRQGRLQYIMTFLERLRNEVTYRSNAEVVTKQNSDLSALLQKVVPDLVGRSLPDCPKGLPVTSIKTYLLFVDAVDLHDQARPPTPKLDFETAFGYF